MNKLASIVVLLGGVGVIGCSSPSPAAPSLAHATGTDTSVKSSTGAPGGYSLTFLARVDRTLQEVASLPVSSAELILRAYVTDSSGNPAQKGTVTFEYCSYKGGPPNDITRADEAPKEACAQGTASWARLTSMSVNPGTCAPLGTGYACMNFGIVQIPRDIGFRFKYSPQGSSIASGVSDAKNFTWVAGS